MKVSFVARTYEIIHLAEEVDEEDGLVIQILQSMHLLLIEVVHFVWRYYTIVVEVDDFEPVLDAPPRRLIFLTEHEPNEVLVIHFVLGLTLELAWHLVKDTIDGLPRQRVPLIPRKVLLVDQKVVVGVQLPESTIKDVEVLV